VNSGQVAAHRNRDEIADAIRTLTSADWARLRKVANYYARPQIGPKDLLQEAFVRALDGRTCPAHVDVVKFLAEAMRSIADGESEKVEHRLPLVSIVAKTGEALPQAVNHPDPALSAEDWLIDEEEAGLLRRNILAIFDDDPVAQIIVEGMMEEMNAEELRELSGLDKTAYDSKRKLIRRRIDKQYPEGWKP